MLSREHENLMAEHAAEVNQCLHYAGMLLEQDISRDPSRFQPHMHCGIGN